MMAKLTIIVKSSSDFITVVRNDDDEISRRHYTDSENCSYSKESADMTKPYITDALQSVIDRYRVQDMVL